MEPGNNIIMVLILVMFVIYTLAKFEIIRDLDVLFLSREKKGELKNFFSKHFHYFNQLPEKDKQLFVIRAYKLSKYLNIIGRQDFIITEHVKLFVVAANVQLTLGYDTYYLNRFNTILVYPDAYKNKITGNMHYGEVNPGGFIVLAWNRLVKGYDIIDDKINLGLHEMAHALMHSIIHHYDHEYGIDAYLRNIVRLSKDEMEHIKNDNNHFFRKYAGTNIFEFFAVSVEYFFEVPEEFQQQLPQLYKYMSLMLKQDPAKKQFHKW